MNLCWGNHGSLFLEPSNFEQRKMGENVIHTLFPPMLHEKRLSNYAVIEPRPLIAVSGWGSTAIAKIACRWQYVELDFSPFPDLWHCLRDVA